MANANVYLAAILTIMDILSMKNPSFIAHQNSFSNNHMLLLKQFSANGHYFHLVPYCSSYTSGHSFIWNLNYLDSNLTFPLDGKSLVLTKMVNEMDLSKLSLTIDQEVYIFDWKSMKLFETYSINGVNVINELGHLIKDEAIDVWIFNHSNLISELFERRRGNFHGKHLVGMTNEYAPSVVLPKDFEEKVKYFPENETYDVTEYVTGTYIDFLHLSQSLLNFTSTIYMRKDRVWGNAVKYKNGTTQYSGMLQNVCENSADFIWTVIARTVERDQCLEYLPSMNGYYGAIYLPSLNESYDWYVFVAPFTPNLWIAIIIISLINAILITVLDLINFNNLVSPLVFCVNGNWNPKENQHFIITQNSNYTLWSKHY